MTDTQLSGERSARSMVGPSAAGASHLCSALTNFALAITCARVLSPDDFGAFAQGYALFLLVRGLALAWCAEPLLVHPGDSPHARGVFAGSIRTSLALSLPGAALLVASGTSGVAGSTYALALGAFVPLAIVQDVVRVRLIASDRGGTALMIEAAWAAFTLPPLTWWALHDGEVGLRLLPAIAWMAGGVVAFAIGLACVRTEIRGTGRVDHLRRLRASFALEFMLGAGTVLVLEVLLAVAGDERASAGFRAAQTVFLPLTTLVGAVRVVAIPRLTVQDWATSVRTVVRAGLALAAGVVVAAVVVSYDVLGVGRMLLGEQLDLARELVPWHAVVRVAAVVIAMATIILRAHRAVRATVSAGVLTAGSIVVVAGPAALTGSALTLSVALSITTTIGCAIWLGVTRRAGSTARQPRVSTP